MSTDKLLSVEEGNKIIAEFMGAPKLDGYFVKNYVYDYSWDFLMPVVEKIGMLHWNDRQNNFQPTLERFLENDIEIIWRQVVQFIQWYNQSKIPELPSTEEQEMRMRKQK